MPVTPQQHYQRIGLFVQKTMKKPKKTNKTNKMKRNKNSLTMKMLLFTLLALSSSPLSHTPTLLPALPALLPPPEPGQSVLSLGREPGFPTLAPTYQLNWETRPTGPGNSLPGCSSSHHSHPHPHTPPLEKNFDPKKVPKNVFLGISYVT